MYTLRKFNLVILLLGSTLSICAQDKPLVVATASMIADMVEQIGGAHLSVECIVPIGGDPHIYDATPKDAQLVNEADLVFRNGLTFEGWLNELIENSGSPARVVTVTDGIDAIESLQYENATDPHAWMDVNLALTYILNIKNALSEFDPPHAESYQRNYERYHRELEELDQYIKEAIASIPEKQRILITSHDAFQYYGRRYGIHLESVLGTSTDADVQTSDIIRLNKVIQENSVPALFIESTINPKILKQIAEDQDIQIGGKLYADSLGDLDSGADTYVKMLKYNTDVIVKALSGSSSSKQTQSEASNTPAWWIYGVIIGVCLLAFLAIAKRIG